MGTLEPFNPSRYRLSTREGTEYILDRGFGIRQVRDRQGNTVGFTADGITHSGALRRFQRKLTSRKAGW